MQCFIFLQHVQVVVGEMLLSGTKGKNALHITQWAKSLRHIWEHPFARDQAGFSDTLGGPYTVMATHTQRLNSNVMMGLWQELGCISVVFSYS